MRLGGSEEQGRLDVEEEEEGGGLKIVGKGRFRRIVGGSMAQDGCTSWQLVGLRGTDRVPAALRNLPHPTPKQLAGMTTGWAAGRVGYNSWRKSMISADLVYNQSLSQSI